MLFKVPQLIVFATSNAPCIPKIFKNWRFYKVVFIKKILFTDLNSGPS